MNRIQFRRDTKENWIRVNPILAEGEVGYETDTRNSKIGDGIARWTDLPYQAGDLMSEIGDDTLTGMSQAAITEEIAKTVYLGDANPNDIANVEDKTTADYSEKALQDWDGNDLRKTTYISGVNKYESFSDTKTYKAGDIVEWENKLYKFTEDHDAGAWNEEDVKEWSLKEETEEKVAELENKVKDLQGKIDALESSLASATKEDTIQQQEMVKKEKIVE